MSLDLTKLQKIICYVSADSPVGTIVDSAAQSLSNPPTPMIVRGIDALLCVRLLQDGQKYPADKLAYDTFAADFCDDWKDSTAPLMEADNDNITLNATGDYTELQIPLLASNTSAIIEKITDQDKLDLGMELTGYVAGDEKAKFCLQFGITIRNRRNMTGQSPDEPLETYWTITQSKAVFIQQNFAVYDEHTTGADADSLFTRTAAGLSRWISYLNIFNYITSKRFPGAMTIGNLLKYGTGGTVEDAGVAVSTDGTLTSDSDANIPTEKAVKAYADTKETALGFTPEDVANKATDFTTVNNTLYTTVQAVKNYIDAAVVGLFDDRGNYDASGDTFPASGGSGDAGAILKGDIWTISVAGTLGGAAVSVGDQVRALADAPGQTASNWTISEANIGYVPENESNKTITITSASTDTQYPSAKAVYDNLVLKADKESPVFTGTVEAQGVLNLSSTTYTFGSNGIVFGDGDTGIYEYADDLLSIWLAGAQCYRFNATQFFSTTGNAAIMNVSASNTVPSIVPDNDNTNTGIGGKDVNTVTLIANGTEVCNATTSGFEVDTIIELTTDAGVTIDGCLVKDGKVADVEGKSDAQWNADKVQGVTIDDTAKADGKVLTYNSTSGNLEYATPPGSTGGEANTASNTGSSGIGVIKGKVGVDIQTYKLLGSNGVSITLNGTDYIDVKLDTMTTQGDIIYGGASGAPTRLSKGTAGQVLAMNPGATAPEWVDASSGNASDSDIIAISKHYISRN